MRFSPQLRLALLIPTKVWSYLDNYYLATPSPIMTTGCSGCTFTVVSGTPSLTNDEDHSSSYNLSTSATTNQVYLMQDYQVPTLVRVTAFTVLSASISSWVTVGDNIDPTLNPTCGVISYNNHFGKRQSCNLTGRYVTLVSSGATIIDIKLFKTWPNPTLQYSGVLTQGPNSSYGSYPITFPSSPAGLLITGLDVAINATNFIQFYFGPGPCSNPYSYDLVVTSPTYFGEIMLVSQRFPALVVKVDGGTCGTAPNPASMSIPVIQRVACGRTGTKLSLWFASNMSGPNLYLYNSVIIVGDPCPNAKIIDQVFLVSLTTTALAATIITQSFTEFLDTVGNALQCGPRVYSLLNYTGTYLTLNQGPTTFSLVLQSLLATDSAASPYSLIFRVSLLNYPTIFLEKTLSITIGACVLTNCNYGSLSNYQKVIGDVATFITPQIAVQTPACGYQPQENTVFAQQLTPTAGALVAAAFWTLAGSSMSLQSNDISLAGTSWTIQQKSKFNGIQCGFGSQGTVQWIDPCPTTAFSSPGIIADQFGFITTMAQKVYVFLPWLNDSANLLYGSQLTSSICGVQQYAVTENGSTPPFIQLTVNASGQTVLEFQTSDVAQAITHTIQVSYSLTNYPAITPALLTFKFTFYTIVVPVAPLPQTYQVQSPTLNFQMGAFSISPAAQTATVTYAASLSNLAALPAFITFSQTGTAPNVFSNFAVNTIDNLNVGTYQIIVTATFLMGKYPAQSQTQTFTLTVTAASFSAVSTFNQPPKFAQPVGGPFQLEYGNPWSPSYQLPSIIDPEGKAVTIAVNCGAASSFLTYKMATNTFVMANTDATNIGTYTITIFLTDADGKQSSYSFQIQITDKPAVNLPSITTTTTSASANSSSSTATAATATSIVVAYDFSTFAPAVSYANTDQKTLNNLAVAEYAFANSTIFDWMSAYQKAQKKVKEQQNKIVLEPDVHISKISNFGLVNFAFTKRMFYPPLEMIQNATVEVNSKRSDGVKQLVRALQIRAKPGPESLASNLRLSYTITKYDSYNLQVQLNFTNAIQVSSNPRYPDLLEATFVGNFFFFDTDGKVLPKNKLVSYKLPSQMQFGSKATSTLVELAETVEITSNGIMASNLALNIILSASLQQLWSMVNTQQLVVLMPLWNIRLPANAALFFSFIMTIASFDLVPTDTFYDEYFPKMAQTSAINTNFQTLGFSNMYFCYNIGSLILSFLAFPILALVTLILKPMRRFKCCDWLYLKITTAIFWNSTVKTISQSYTVIVMCVGINSLNMTFASTGEIISSSLTIFFGLIVVAFPIFTVAYLYKNFDGLDTPEMQGKVGSLYSEFYLKRGRGILVSVVIFYFRRFIIPISVVYNQAIIVQIYVMATTIIAQIINIGYLRPFSNGTPANRLETFNEVLLLLIMYTMMCFTDFVPDLETQYGIGYVACSLVVGHLLANLGIMLTTSFKQLTLRVKRFWILRRHEQNIAKGNKGRSVAPLEQMTELNIFATTVQNNEQDDQLLSTQQKTQTVKDCSKQVKKQTVTFSKVDLEPSFSFRDVCFNSKAEIINVKKSYQLKHLEQHFAEVRNQSNRQLFYGQVYQSKKDKVQVTINTDLQIRVPESQRLQAHQAQIKQIEEQEVLLENALYKKIEAQDEVKVLLQCEYSADMGAAYLKQEYQKYEKEIKTTTAQIIELQKQKKYHEAEIDLLGQQQLN